jgi:hypothetical protein
MWFDTSDPRKKKGGGGRVKIAFGRTGPRGRIYAPPPRGTTVVAKSKYIKAGNGARPGIYGHLRYIQERERGEGEPERRFFDREKEGIERKDVYDAMMDGRGDRAAMHTLILSPGDNTIDLADYTRESMKALEERLGHELDWYATTHENTDHHHAHVVIAGKIPDREHEYERQGPDDRRQQEAGKQRGEVYLDRGDLKELRDAGNDYIARERSVDREIERAAELEMTRDIFSRELDREREHGHDRGEDSRRTRGDRGDRSDDEETRPGRDELDRGR